MNYGLDLIMNPSKVKKKKYNLPNINQTKLIDVIQDTISNELNLKDNIKPNVLQDIIRMTIDIYKQNSKIPLDKNIEKKEIKLDFIPGEPIKNVKLSNIKIKEEKKINVEVNKI